MQMIIPGDQGPIHEEEGLFRIKVLKSGSALKKVTEDNDSNIVADSEEDDDELKIKKKKTEKFSREEGKLDKSVLYYKNSYSEDERSDDGSSEDDYLLEEDDTDEKGPITSTGHVNDDEYVKHPLLVDLEDGATRKERRAQVSTSATFYARAKSVFMFLFTFQLWFDKDIFKGIEDDENLEDADVQAAISDIEKKGGMVLTKSQKPQSKSGSNLL